MVPFRWLAWMFDITGSVILFVAIIFVMLYEDELTPGQAGLAISYALNVSIFIIGIPDVNGSLKKVFKSTVSSSSMMIPE